MGIEIEMEMKMGPGMVRRLRLGASCCWDLGLGTFVTMGGR